MPEYGKMKNADLEALLKDRGLPSGGKKADMVERLTKDDENTKTSMSKVTLGAEDEIDWDDDIEEPTKAAPVATTSTTAVKPALAAGSAPADRTAPETKSVRDQTATPKGSNDEVVQMVSATKDADGTAEAKQEDMKEDKKEPAPDFTKGLAATNLEEEIEKRKRRAAKFGMKIEDDEGLKKLERMKKFGETGPPKGLDEALPERTKKRSREEGDDAEGNKRHGGSRAGGRGGNARREHRGDKDNRERGPHRGASKANGGASWMSDKDKQAAEARKAKWAKPAAS